MSSSDSSVTGDGFDQARLMTQQLQPFWDLLGEMQTRHDWLTDAHFLAALFDVQDSVLVALMQDDNRDLAAARKAIQEVVNANRVPGVGGGMSVEALRVVTATSREAESRRDVQRQEYVLLGLLDHGVDQVRTLLGALGIERGRILRHLPPGVIKVMVEPPRPSVDSQTSTSPADGSHASAVRLLEFINGRPGGRAPRPEYVLVELTQLPYSPVARIAIDGGYQSGEIMQRLREMSHEASQDDYREPRDWTGEADRIIARAFELSRGGGTLLLEHFVLALLEVGGGRVVDVLTSLGITAARLRTDVVGDQPT